MKSLLERKQEELTALCEYMFQASASELNELDRAIDALVSEIEFLQEQEDGSHARN